MGKNNYVNFHRHCHYSNIISPDCAIKPIDYINRAIELNQTAISCVQHGTTAGYFEYYELCKKYNLKFIYGSEVYISLNENKEDKTNAHMIILSKNQKGFKILNSLLSRANTENYYYKARISLEWLLNLSDEDSDNIVITTACVGGIWKYDNYEEIIIKLNNKFKNNFYLEVQYHNTQSQKNINYTIMELSNKYNIPIIMGCDSHMIYEEQKKDRDAFLYAKGISYEDEEGWFLDYPSYEECFNRFEQQGVLKKEEIISAIKNTNICLSFDSIEFNNELKIPSVYPNKSQKEKNEIFKNIILEEAKKKFGSLSNIEEEYKIAIKNEVKVVIDTNMADYFILNYYIIKKGIEKGGKLTLTSRGSCPSFYINNLLGFTTIDRVKSPVTLYPERFATVERVLAGSVFDIDFNIADRQPFIDAQNEILGEDKSYWLSTYGTLKVKSSFKMYAKANDIPFEISNNIIKYIDKYESAIKYAEEEEKENINPDDFIPSEYREIFNNSKKYNGLIDSISSHPCFAKETLVLTSEGYKNIENIKEGDYVLTHSNSYKKVIKTMKRISKDVYDLKITGDKIKVTGNHPFYVIKNIEKNNNKINPIWKNVEDLEKNDMIGFSINTESKIPNILKEMTNNNFWWIIGRYMGDGWIEEFERKSGKGKGQMVKRTIICCPKQKDELLSITSKLDNMFEYRVQEERTTYKIILKHNKVLFDYLKTFGKYAYGKHLTKDIFNLPLELLKSFLEGYLSADGHFSNNIFKFSTVSKELAYGLQQCIHKVYKRYCGITIDNRCGKDIIEGRTVNRRKQYKCSFKLKDSKKDMNFFKEGFMWVRYKNKNKEIFNDYVYNLEVEEDHSYTANNCTVHNCAFILSPFSISDNIGIIKAKDFICANIEGKYMDKYMYMKNDLLAVTVVDIIYKTFEKIGITPFTTNELMEKIKSDNKTWDVYKNGNTIGLNQVEQPKAREKIMKYKPKNISELSAFVCAIRPSFQSMINVFLNREDFSYNIPDFDNLLITEELPQSFLLTQEQVMKVLGYVGFEISESYTILKSIAKKKQGVVEPLKNRFVDGFIEKGNKKEEAETVWQIIQDSSNYLFNSSHALSVALDSVYGAYLKAHYPLEFYTTMIEIYTEKKNNEKVASVKQEMKFFNIKEGLLRFGENNSKITYNKEKNTISSLLASIKDINKDVGERLYELSKQKKYYNFLDLLKDIKEQKVLQSNQLEILIKLDYFSEFGKSQYLLDIVSIYENFYSKKQISKSDLVKLNITSDTMERFSNKQTEKLYKEIDNEGLVKYLISELDDKDISLKEKLHSQKEYIGYIEYTNDKLSDNFYYVLETKFYQSKNKPYLKLYRLKDGNTVDYRINDGFEFNTFKDGDIIKVIKEEKKNKSRLIEGKWVKLEGEFNNFIKSWQVL